MPAEPTGGVGEWPGGQHPSPTRTQSRRRGQMSRLPGMGRPAVRSLGRWVPSMTPSIRGCWRNRLKERRSAHSGHGLHAHHSMLQRGHLFGLSIKGGFCAPFLSTLRWTHVSSMEYAGSRQPWGAPLPEAVEQGLTAGSPAWLWPPVHKPLSWTQLHPMPHGLVFLKSLTMRN